MREYGGEHNAAPLVLTYSQTVTADILNLYVILLEEFARALHIIQNGCAADIELIADLRDGHRLLRRQQHQCDGDNTLLLRKAVGIKATVADVRLNAENLFARCAESQTGRL